MEKGSAPFKKRTSTASFEHMPISETPIEQRAEKAQQLIAETIERVMGPHTDIPAEEELAREKAVIQAIDDFTVDESEKYIFRHIGQNLKHAPLLTVLQYLSYFERITIRENARFCLTNPSRNAIDDYVDNGFTMKMMTGVFCIEEEREEIFLEPFANRIVQNTTIHFNNHPKITNLPLIRQANIEGLHIYAPERTHPPLPEHIAFDPPITPNEHAYFISNTVVGIFDEFGNLNRIAELNRKIADTQFPYSREDIERLRSESQLLATADPSPEQFVECCRTAVELDPEFIKTLIERQLISAADAVLLESVFLATSDTRVRTEDDLNPELVQKIKGYIDIIKHCVTGNPDIELTEEGNRSEAKKLDGVKLFLQNDWSQRIDDLLAQKQYRSVYNILYDIYSELIFQGMLKKPSDESMIFIGIVEKIRTLYTTHQTTQEQNTDPSPKLSIEQQNMLARLSQNTTSLITVFQEIADTRMEEYMAAMIPTTTIDIEDVLGHSKWNPQNAEQENTDELLGLIRILYTAESREIIESSYDLLLSKLSLSSQIQFIRFIAQANHSMDVRMRKILRSFSGSPYDFLESFFVLAEDTQHSEKLLTILERQQNPYIERILRLYAKIVRRISDIESYVTTTLQQHSSVDSRVVVEALLQRANHMLFTMTDEVLAGRSEEISEKFAQLNDEVITFASLCEKTLKNNRDIRIEDLAHVDYQEIRGDKLSEDQKTRILTIAKANHAMRPHVWKDIEAIFSDPAMQARLNNTTFKLIERKLPEDTEPTLLSFLRIEDIDDDNVYIGWLNVNSHSQGAGIGEHILPLVLQEIHPGKNIHAVVTPDVRAGTYYIDTIGADITDFTTSQDPTNLQDSHFQIFLPRKDIKAERDAQSRLRGMSRSELLSQYQTEYASVDPLSLQGQDVILAQFHIGTEMEDICQVADTLLHNPGGYTMTRYFCVDTQTDQRCEKRLYAFEKKSTDAQ